MLTNNDYKLVQTKLKTDFKIKYFQKTNVLTMLPIFTAENREQKWKFVRNKENKGKRENVGTKYLWMVGG